MPDYVRALYTSVKNTWQDAENLDDTHGYTTYIWIPEETYKIDVMRLRLFAEKFRAHSKSALDGGADVVTSEEKTPNHKHQVVIGTPTSESGGGRHRHDVEIGVKTSKSTGDTLAGKIATSLTALYAHIKDDPESDLLAFLGISDSFDLNIPNEEHTHTVNIGTPTSEYETPNHIHDVVIGTKTSAEGGGAHSHQVTLEDHTHEIDFGIYEEDIAGRTLSAVLYDTHGVELKDFGVLLTGEDSEEIDLTDYFETLQYGMYKLVLSASGRLRARMVFYELCKMYAQT